LSTHSVPLKKGIPTLWPHQLGGIKTSLALLKMKEIKTRLENNKRRPQSNQYVNAKNSGVTSGGKVQRLEKGAGPSTKV